MLIGAAVQSLPDIDFVFAFFMDVSKNLLAHRGITHSLFFLLLAVPLVAWIGYRTWKNKLSWRQWIFFISLEIGCHLLLDSLNNYGMGLLEPFDHTRVALHAIFVADPLFTIWPLIASLVLLVTGINYRNRKFWWKAGIYICAVYLVFVLVNKFRIDAKLEKSLQQQGLAYERKLSTPTPFNNLLWFLAAGGEDGFYVGYRSIFDNQDSIAFQYFPRNKQLLNEVRNQEEVQDLIRFSQGFYTVEKWGDTIVFNDLRFGQVTGWHDPNQKFVFHYFLDHANAENRLVVQRGRFAGWNRESLQAMWDKVVGNKQ